MEKCKYCGLEFSEKVVFIHEQRCSLNPANVKKNEEVTENNENKKNEEITENSGKKRGK